MASNKITIQVCIGKVLAWELKAKGLFEVKSWIIIRGFKDEVQHVLMIA